VGEYTCKATRQESKQTVQFKFEDITFLKRNTKGQLRCIAQTAPDWMIATANGATLKLDNKKMAGRECVSTKKQMVTIIYVPSKP
jgi:hypothetical protein